MENIARIATPRLGVILLCWAAAAVTLSASGLVAQIPPPVIFAVLVGSVAGFLLSLRRPGLARSVADGLDLRLAVGLHIIRAPIGAAFLVAHSRGMLPGQFAVPAGSGDIVAGVLAIAALAALPATTSLRRRFVLGWNLLALADILMVVFLAQRIILAGEAPPAFLTFPFPLLPLFVVPLVIITHVIVLRRLRRAA